jgi:LAO/AO transport system kinase
VNKADRDGAHALMADIRFSVHLSHTSRPGPSDVDWEPPVLAAQAANDVGVVELLDTIERHRAALTESGALHARRRSRRRVELDALLVEAFTAEVAARAEADPELATTLAAAADGTLDAYSAVARIVSKTLAQP